jgi:hypothetical protein
LTGGGTGSAMAAEAAAKLSSRILSHPKYAVVFMGPPECSRDAHSTIRESRSLERNIFARTAAEISRFPPSRLDCASVSGDKFQMVRPPNNCRMTVRNALTGM